MPSKVKMQQIKKQLKENQVANNRCLAICTIKPSCFPFKKLDTKQRKSTASGLLPLH